LLAIVSRTSVSVTVPSKSTTIVRRLKGAT
jgi:hypothetical protein